MTDSPERLAREALSGDLEAADRLAQLSARRGLDEALEPVFAALVDIATLAAAMTQCAAGALPGVEARDVDDWVCVALPVARVAVTARTVEATRNVQGHAGTPALWQQALQWLPTGEGQTYLGQLTAAAESWPMAKVTTTGSLGSGAYPLAALSVARAVWWCVDRVDGGFWNSGGVLVARHVDESPPHWQVTFRGGLLDPGSGRRPPSVTAWRDLRGRTR